jgi:hypothetical protein
MRSFAIRESIMKKRNIVVACCLSIILMFAFAACSESGSARQGTQESNSVEQNRQDFSIGVYDHYTIDANDVLDGSTVTLFRSGAAVKDDSYTVTITDVSLISVDEIRKEVGDAYQSESGLIGFQNGLIRVEYVTNNPTGYDVVPFLPFELYQITNINYKEPYEQGEFKLHSFFFPFDGTNNNYYESYIEYEDGSRSVPYSGQIVRPKEKATCVEYFSLNERDSSADIEFVLESGYIKGVIDYQEWQELEEQGKYPQDFILSYHMDDLR